METNGNRASIINLQRPSVYLSQKMVLLRDNNNELSLPKVSSSIISPKTNPEPKEDLVLKYRFNENGKLVTKKLNFDSPSTKDAAGRLGITFDDCVPK